MVNVGGKSSETTSKVRIEFSVQRNKNTHCARGRRHQGDKSVIRFSSDINQKTLKKPITKGGYLGRGFYSITAKSLSMEYKEMADTLLDTLSVTMTYMQDK